jgi:hypothetical protein
VRYGEQRSNPVGNFPWDQLKNNASRKLLRIATPLLGYCWSMMFSDLPSPAEASSQLLTVATGFAQAGNRYPLFGIML